MVKRKFNKEKDYMMLWINGHKHLNYDLWTNTWHPYF